jgi:hypothetical protein
MKYGIIFWGSSVDSKGVVQLQKQTVRIMTGTKSRISYKHLFRGFGNTDFTLSIYTAFNDLFDT